MADQPVDRVAMASRQKDGTPDQTEGYEIVGDKETAIAATAEQLGQMAVSAADQANPPPSGNPDEVAGPNAEEQKRIDEHQALLDAAQSEAEAEVAARFVDPAAATVETTSRKAAKETTASA